MSQQREDGVGVAFSVAGAGGAVLEREICSGDLERVLRYFWAHREARGLVGVAWRYGPLHGWQARPSGGAWVPEPLRCPEFRRVQGLAYRRLAAFLAAGGVPRAEAQRRLERLCGYYPDLHTGVRSIVEHEIASSLPNLVRFVDMSAVVRDLLHLGAIEVVSLPREADDPADELPPGVFVLRA